MAITTRAGVLAGLMPSVAFAKASSATTVNGRPQSLYLLGGNPAAGSVTAGLTGATYSTSSAVPAGILYRKDPASGNAYLARLRVVSNLIGTVLLCDRLWDCSPATAVTTAQTVTSPTLPARDSLGQTNGLGVQMAIEVVGATSATAATISMSYTNSGGTSGKTASFVDAPTAAAAQIGQFFRIGLAAGDLGVQSVQSVTFAADWTSGSIALVAYRVLAKFDLQVPNEPNMIDDITSGFPQLYNGTCPFLVFICSSNSNASISGEYIETQG